MSAAKPRKPSDPARESQSTRASRSTPDPSFAQNHHGHLPVATGVLQQPTELPPHLLRSPSPLRIGDSCGPQHVAVFQFARSRCISLVRGMLGRCECRWFSIT